MKITKTKEQPTLSISEILFIKGKLYRIIGRKPRLIDSRIKDCCTLIELEVAVFRIVCIETEAIINGYVAGDIMKCTEPDPLTPARYPERILAERRAAIIQYIRSIDDDYSILQRRGEKDDPVAILEKAFGVRRRQAKRYVLRYLQNGFADIALVDTRQCVCSKGMGTSKCVRGRKLIDENGIPRSTIIENGEELFSFFEKVKKAIEHDSNRLQTNAGTKNRVSAKSAFLAFATEKYGVKSEDGALRLPTDRTLYPSYKRFLTWLKKEYKKRASDLKMSSTARFNDRRLLTGDSRIGAMPGDTFEIDADEIPLILTSSMSNGRGIVGKPILYLAVDNVTGMFTGFSVNIKVNNSYEGFMDLADAIMMTDRELADFIGIEDEDVTIRNDIVIPNRVLVDHGSEYTSNIFRDNLTGTSERFTMDGVKIDIQLAPVGVGSMKPRIESFFHQLELVLREALANRNGIITASHGSDHYDQAVLDLNFIRRACWRIVRAFNKEIAVKNHPAWPMLTEKAPHRTPCEIWDALKEDYGVSQLADEKSIRMLRFGLLKKMKLKLSRKMIHLKNKVFWDISGDRELVAEALSLGNKTEDIEIRYDPRCADSIYRVTKDGRAMKYKMARHHMETTMLSGMRWEELIKYVDEESSRRYRFDQMNDDVRATLVSKIRMDAAENAATHMGELNKKDIRDRGLIEKAGQRAYDSVRKESIFGDLFEDGSAVPAVTVAVTEIKKPGAPSTEPEDEAAVSTTEIDLDETYGFLNE